MENLSRTTIFVSRATLLWSFLALSGCGGAMASPLSPSATTTTSFAASAAPAPTGQVQAVAAARFERAGNGNWMACFGVGVAGYTQCAFQGTVRNAGPGCATAIRGVTHFYDSNKQEAGAFSWSVESATPTHADETVTYRTGAVPIAIVNATAAYEVTDLVWTNTACS